MSTPISRAYSGSIACSASMNAHTPPSFWASAMMWYISVVLPEDSGPKTSTMRPRGTPPIPSARSSDERPGRHDPDTHLGALVAHAHDGALAELAFDLGERALEGGIAGLGGLLVFGDGHGRRTFLLWLRRAILRPAADGTDPRSGSCDGATPLCSDCSEESVPTFRADPGGHGNRTGFRPAPRRRCGPCPDPAISPTARAERARHPASATATDEPWAQPALYPPTARTGSPSPTSRKGHEDELRGRERTVAVLRGARRGRAARPAARRLRRRRADAADHPPRWPPDDASSRSTSRVTATRPTSTARCAPSTWPTTSPR